MSNTPTYEIIPPYFVAMENLPAFKTLVGQRQTESLLPSHITDFMQASNGQVMTRVPETKPVYVAHPTQANVISRVILFSAPPREAGGAPRYAALLLDQINNTLKPRQWVVSPDLQAVIPYKMSCCSDLSAIGTIKTKNGMFPMLYEDPKFVLAEQRDVFGIDNPKPDSGLAIDPTNETLSGWFKNMTGQSSTPTPPVP